jgi:hypothetical protein
MPDPNRISNANYIQGTDTMRYQLDYDMYGRVSKVTMKSPLVDEMRTFSYQGIVCTIVSHGVFRVNASTSTDTFVATMNDGKMITTMLDYGRTYLFDYNDTQLVRKTMPSQGIVNDFFWSKGDLDSCVTNTGITVYTYDTAHRGQHGDPLSMFDLYNCGRSFIRPVHLITSVRYPVSGDGYDYTYQFDALGRIIEFVEKKSTGEVTAIAQYTY